MCIIFPLDTKTHLPFRKLNKLFQFVDSLGTQHTEPLCGWRSGILENEDTLYILACAYKKITRKIMLVIDEIFACYWLDL